MQTLKESLEKQTLVTGATWGTSAKNSEKSMGHTLQVLSSQIERRLKETQMFNTA
jgi:hypothetical protein